MTVTQTAPQGQPSSAPRIVFTGWSGKTYTFRLYELGQHFKAAPGLYAMCKLTPQNTLDVLYIGETHDLDNRVGSGLACHHKVASAIVAGAGHICAMIISGEREDRLFAETDLRQSYNPPLNDQ